MFSIIIILSTSILYGLVNTSNKTYTASMDTLELLTASYVPDYYNISVFRVAKYNRTTHVLNWDIELFIDLDESVSLEIQLYVSRLNNNQYQR